MYELIKGDILNVERGILVHQVNSQGVMGAGLAKAIKEKYPIIFEKYSTVCLNAKEDTSSLLGKIQVIQVEDNKELYIVNLFGQNHYGRGKRHTDYTAFREAFSKLIKFSVEKKLPLYVPDRIGCNLAGGEWSVIEKIIVEELELHEMNGVLTDCKILTLSTEHLCQVCLTNPFTQLCDYRIGTGYITSVHFRELTKTCDKKLCRNCATNLWSECDLCPEHVAKVRESLSV